MVLEDKLNCSYFKCKQELIYSVAAVGIQPYGEILFYCNSVCASFARVEEYKNIRIISNVTMPDYQKCYKIH